MRADRIIETLRRYWISAVAVTAIAVAISVILISQSSSGNPTRDVARQAAAFNRKLAAQGKKETAAAAAHSAANAAAERQAARDAAASYRQDDATAAQDGEDGPDAVPGQTQTTTPPTTTTTTRPATTTQPAQPVTRTVTTQTAATHTRSSTSTAAITNSQLKGMDNDDLLSAEYCLALSEDKTPSDAQVSGLARAVVLLPTYLRRDPDTHYAAIGGGTVRELVGEEINILDNGTGYPCDPSDAQMLRTDLASVSP